MIRRWLAARANRRRIRALEREIERDLAVIRIVSRARAEAARKGKSTEIARVGRETRALFKVAN